MGRRARAADRRRREAGERGARRAAAVRLRYVPRPARGGQGDDGQELLPLLLRRVRLRERPPRGAADHREARRPVLGVRARHPGRRSDQRQRPSRVPPASGGEGHLPGQLLDALPRVQRAALLQQGLLRHDHGGPAQPSRRRGGRGRGARVAVRGGREAAQRGPRLPARRPGARARGGAPQGDAGARQGAAHGAGPDHRQPAQVQRPVQRPRLPLWPGGQRRRQGPQPREGVRRHGRHAHRWRHAAQDAAGEEAGVGRRVRRAGPAD